MQKSNWRETNIDYYCFPNSTLNLVPTDLENMGIRERAKHDSILKEVEKARIIEKLLLYDPKNNNFINEKGENVDIRGKVILPRNCEKDKSTLLESIKNAQGISITTREDDIKLWKWFEKIPIRRAYDLATKGILQERFNYFKRKYGSFLFVKTLDEKFSGMVILLKVFEDRPTLVDCHYHALHRSIEESDTPIILYKWVEPLKDDFGNRQWRAFVVNNELISLSRCSESSTPIEPYVYEEVKKRVGNYKDLLPSTYIVDFGEYKEGNETIFDVLDFYSITSARSFANNF